MRISPKPSQVRKLVLQAAKLPQIVEYNKKKVTEVHMEDLRTSLSEAINADPPVPVEEIIELIQQKRKEQELPDIEVIQVHFAKCNIDLMFCTTDKPSGQSAYLPVMILAWSNLQASSAFDLWQQPL